MSNVPRPKTMLALKNLIIHQVEQSDLPALEWDGEYLKYRRMYANLYQNRLMGKTLMWITQLPQGELIGQAFVMLKSSKPNAADGKHRAYVFAFRIKPLWRNKGIGTYLMDYVENDLRQRDYQYVTLNVAKENPGALRLYQRLGYTIIGSQPGIWSFKDHTGTIHHIEEPAWRMIKQIKRD